MRFLVPLRLEAIPVRRGAPFGRIERVGMGPARAQRFASAFVRRSLAPEPLVVAGVAGGLAPGDRPGDVIVASVLRSTAGDPDRALAEAEAVAKLLWTADIPARLGPVVSSPVIVHGAARDELGRAGAAAVDMESYWLAALSDRHPFAVVRVLLDVPAYRFSATTASSATRAAYRSLREVSRLVAGWSPVSVDRYPLTQIGDA